MTETLKEAKPSEEALTFPRALDIAQYGFNQWKEKPYNAKWFKRIDGTPIPNDLLVNIAEAFVLVYRISTSPYPRECRDGEETDVAPLIAEIDRLKEERDALKARVAELEKNRREEELQEDARLGAALARAQSAESSLAASRRQVEIARDYINIHGRVCGVLTPLASEVLSALDAPQPEARDAVIAEAVEIMRDALMTSIGERFPRWTTAARAFIEKHGGGR